MSNPKTGENTQFARVAEATGLAPAGTTGLPNDGLAPLCDDQGRLLVVAATPGGGGGGTGTIAPYDSAALETSAVLLGTPGTLLYVQGFNATAGLLYVQTFDLAAMPVGGEVPQGVNLPVPAGEMFSSVLGAYGRPFATGIVVALSTTPATYTAAAAAAGWFNAQVQS